MNSQKKLKAVSIICLLFLLGTLSACSDNRNMKKKPPKSSGSKNAGSQGEKPDADNNGGDPQNLDQDSKTTQDKEQLTKTPDSQTCTQTSKASTSPLNLENLIEKSLNLNTEENFETKEPRLFTLPFRDSLIFKLKSDFGNITFKHKHLNYESQRNEFKVIVAYKGTTSVKVNFKKENDQFFIETQFQIKNNNSPVSTGANSANVHNFSGNVNYVINDNCDKKTLSNGDKNSQLELIVLLPTSDIKKIEVENTNGNLNVSDLSTPLELILNSSNGNITYENSEGILIAQLKNGNISISSHKNGNLSLKTENGNISLKGHDTGDVLIHTKNGNITAKENKNGKLDFMANSGNISINQHENGELLLKSDSGNIFVENTDCNKVTMNNTSGKSQCQ